MTEVEGKRRANLHEWLARFQRLLYRGLTVRAAETVIDAAMFGHGCTEGTVRQEIEDMKHKEALEKIGNLIGAPTTHYLPEQQRKELLARLDKISAIVQEALGIPQPPAPDSDNLRTNSGIDKVLGGEYYIP
jgi:hypothetical protein